MKGNRKIGLYLFNPFIYISDYKALGIGVVLIVMAAIVGSWGNAYFDGVLDIHTTAGKPWWYGILLGLLDWLCMSAVLLTFGAVIAKTKYRLIDIIGTQALARWPSIIAGAAALLFKFSTPGTHIIIEVVVISIMIGSLVWMVSLMINSYAISFNLHGVKMIVSFIAAMVIAEAVSKIIVIKLL